MTSTTIEPYFDYLLELPLGLLETELETAKADLNAANQEVTNSQSYGGFPAKLKIAKRKQIAAKELIKNINIVVRERQENDY